MKYKIGDRVRIVSSRDGQERWNSSCLMDKYMGTIMTIDGTRRTSDGYTTYRMREDNGKWQWYPWMIKCKEEKDMFGKSDLSNGDLLVMRNGEHYVVMKNYYDGKDTWLCVNAYGWLDPYTSFGEEMRCSTMDCFDVMRVLRPNGRFANFARFCEDDYKVVYERDESRKKMTVEDIERELGYKVAIVDKDGVSHE